MRFSLPRMPAASPAILFDFDGVLVDSEPLHLAAFRVFAGRLGVEISQADYDDVYIGFDDRDAFRELHRVAGVPLDDATLAALIEDKAGVFERVTREAAAAGGLALPGAVALVRAVEAAGLPHAIGSGATRADIELMLDLIGCRDAFDLIVSADDVARSKPDPETYLRCAELLAVTPADCLVIEDTPAGLASARAAGMRTLAVANSLPADQLDADTVVADTAAVDLGLLRALAASD